MDWKQIYLDTFITEFPKLWNTSFDVFERYLNVFYDGDRGILVKPLETTGKIKGATGEFVTAVVDNLVVRNQWTNLYDNSNTADYDFWKTQDSSAFVPRDPCTAINNWPYENPIFKYIDVNKAFYKITNEDIISFQNENVSQVVGIMLDPCLYSTDPFYIVLDPCSGSYFQIDSSLAGSYYMEFIMTEWDASWGSTWSQYKYGITEGGSSSGGGGSGTVGPGTINTIPLFNSTTSIINSPLTISAGSLNTPDVSINGILDIDGSVNQFGKEITKYLPNLSPSLSMPEDVGGIDAGTTVADLSGFTYEQLMNSLLFPTVLAYIETINNLVLSGLSSTIAEVGTSYTPSLTATYNPGLIKNGDDTNGPNLTGDASLFTFKLPDGTIDSSIIATGNSEGLVFSSYDVEFGTNTWSVTTDYNIGTGLYYDNKGIAVTNLDASRVASFKTANSGTITGRRYAWWGSGIHYSAPLDSTGVRLLSDKQFLNASNKGTFDISIPAGTQEVYFFIPEGNTVVVQYVESSFADVTGGFTYGGFNVDDAAGNPQSYDKWVQFIGTTGYPATATYRVTIS